MASSNNLRGIKPSLVLLLIGVVAALLLYGTLRHGAVSGEIVWPLTFLCLTAGAVWICADRFANRFSEAHGRANEAQSQLAAIVESCEDAIIGMTLDGIVTSWNAGAENIYGYTQEDIVGQSVTLLNPPDRPNEIPDLLEMVAQGKGINRYETERIRKDGRRLYVSASVSPIKDPAGKIVGASTIARDITSLKMVEERLRTHASHMETLYTVAQEVGGTLSLGDVVERALRRLTAAAGFDHAFMRFYDANGEPRSYGASVRADIAPEDFDDLKHLSEATVDRMPDPSQPWFVEDANKLGRIGPVYSAAGMKALVVLPLPRSAQLHGALTLMHPEAREYTAEHCQFLQALAHQIGLAVENASLYGNTLQINAHLQGEIEERRRAEKLLADFTAMVVHDLRAPLSNLASIAESLQDEVFGEVNADQKQWLGKMRGNCMNLVEHITQFLDLSKMEAGHIKLVKAPADMGTILRECMLQYSIQAGKRSVDLVVAIAADLPPVTLDTRLINQVLENLLNNALKFTQAGGRIEIGARSESALQITAWVKDTGLGIPKDEIPLIFEKYRQVSSGQKSAPLGTGLGLAICKKIIEAHDGVLWVESEEDQGATFFFTLPAGLGEPAEIIQGQLADL